MSLPVSGSTCDYATVQGFAQIDHYDDTSFDSNAKQRYMAHPNREAEVRECRPHPSAEFLALPTWIVHRFQGMANHEGQEG